MSKHLLTLAVALICASPVIAQSVPVQAGDVVRVTSSEASGRFTVTGMSAESLTLRDASGAVVSVSLGSVTDMKVSRGPRSPREGALRGAGYGFLAGAAAGALLGFADGDDPPEEWWFRYSAEEKAVMLGVVFGGAAGILGALLGLEAPGERWESVPLQEVRLGAARDGGLAVGYSLRF